MDIAYKIKYLRKNLLNISQEKFAKKINVTRTTINSWEQGLTKPSLSHIITIALTCNVTTDYLINKDEPLSLAVRNLSEDEYQLLLQLVTYFKQQLKK